MAKEEEVKLEEVRGMVVSEAGGRCQVCMGARQRGRSSTLQDARPAPTFDRGVREREQVNITDSHRQRRLVQMLLLLLKL